MEKLIKKSRKIFAATTCLLLILIMNSCKKDSSSIVTTQSFARVNLVSGSSSTSGGRVDPNLKNGWGIAFSPTGTAWISAQAAGVSLVYDQTGAQKLTPVNIPSSLLPVGGAPTGQVYNGTTDFNLPNASPAKFIFVGDDGIISGWNGGGAAVKMVDHSSTSSYTGVALGSSGGNNYLYTSNFKTGHIDVFDKNFSPVSMSFTDPTLPSGYSPFNIQNLDGQLYVMYADQGSDGDEEKGAGLGFVDVYNTDGSFANRFASQGELNAPWAIVKAPAGFVFNAGETILVGNFGDGHINAFSTSGNFLGTLRSNGTPVAIDGLWGMSFAPSASAMNPYWLFFAAGPNDESDGQFGYITN